MVLSSCSRRPWHCPKDYAFRRLSCEEGEVIITERKQGSAQASCGRWTERQAPRSGFSEARSQEKRVTRPSIRE